MNKQKLILTAAIIGVVIITIIVFTIYAKNQILSIQP